MPAPSAESSRRRAATSSEIEEEEEEEAEEEADWRSGQRCMYHPVPSAKRLSWSK